MTWRGTLRGRIFVLLLVALLAVCCSRSEKADFECPEQFGYYPDGNDCNRYFVCVFGGALHESCNGGLFFSVDLHTCDWPRNVKCNAVNGVRSNHSENSDGDASSSTTARTANLKLATPASNSKPSTLTSSSSTEVSTARKVSNNHNKSHISNNNNEATASQTVVREQGVATPATIKNTPPSTTTSATATRTSTVSNEQQSNNDNGGDDDDDSSDSQSAAEEELLAEGFTEIYDVPRTVAKGSKCLDCSVPSSNQPTGPLVVDDESSAVMPSGAGGSGSETIQGPLAVDASSQSTEKHHGAVVGPPQRPLDLAAVSEATPVTPKSAVQTATSELQDTSATGGDSGSGGDDGEDQQTQHYEYYDQDVDFDTDKDGRDAEQQQLDHLQSTTTKTSSSPLPATTTSTRSPIVPQTPPSTVRRQYELLEGSDMPAKRCDPAVCKLPSCFCGGNQIIPGGFKVDDIPQMVLITFDDAVNDINWPLYEQLFYKGRKNPHGCPISATFYVSHEWTDYGKVQTLYSDGHEIASHSITHSFGQDFAKLKWEDEIYGQKEILSTYAGIKYNDIRGMRAPFLQIGGNKQYMMLYENNFTYDSSMPVYENKPPFWPYTLDAALPHECMIPPCPTLSFPGVWQIPLVMWVDLNGGRCSMADACSNPPTAEGVYKMLVKNFERHYLTNRAPFGLFYHSAWFAIPHHREGFEAFLDALVTMDDVFLITSSQLVDWMKDPTPLAKVKEFPAWQCHTEDRVPPCKKPKVCNLWFKGGVRYMKTCQPCPSVYPWVTNTGSKNQTSLPSSSSPPPSSSSSVAT